MRGVVRPVDVAYDWVSKRFYWADVGRRRIVATGVPDRDDYNVVSVVKENLHDLHAIAVNPVSGCVLVFDLNLVLPCFMLMNRYCVFRTLVAKIMQIEPSSKSPL